MAERSVANLSAFATGTGNRARAADLSGARHQTRPGRYKSDHIGKRLAGKLHEPFERAGGGRAQARPLPTLQLRSRRTKRSNPLRSRWSQGRGPRGTWASKARAGRRTGKACHRRWNAYGGPHVTRALCRQIPKGGAECLNWARSDLCGGRSEMSVLTGNVKTRSNE